MHRVLALIGLVLMPLGFLHDSARDIGPLLRIIAPSYVAISELFEGELSREGACLDNKSAAFERLVGAIAPILSPPATYDSVSRVCRLGGISYVTGPKAPASGFTIRAHLADGSIAWTNSIEVNSALERTLDARLFFLGALVFGIGYASEFASFVLDR